MMSCVLTMNVNQIISCIECRVGISKAIQEIRKVTLDAICYAFVFTFFNDRYKQHVKAMFTNMRISFIRQSYALSVA